MISNILSYYMFIILFIWTFTFFESTCNIRGILFILAVLFYIFEKYISSSLPNNTGGDILSIQLMYTNIIFYLMRFGFLLLIVLILLIKTYTYQKDNKIARNVSEYDYYNTITPIWMRKYYNKITLHNDYLLEKFRKMNELLNNETPVKGKKYDN